MSFVLLAQSALFGNTAATIVDRLKARLNQDLEARLAQINKDIAADPQILAARREKVAAEQQLRKYAQLATDLAGNLEQLEAVRGKISELYVPAANQDATGLDGAVIGADTSATLFTPIASDIVAPLTDLQDMIDNGVGVGQAAAYNGLATQADKQAAIADVTAALDRLDGLEKQMRMAVDVANAFARELDARVKALGEDVTELNQDARTAAIKALQEFRATRELQISFLEMSMVGNDTVEMLKGQINRLPAKGSLLDLFS